MNIFDNFVIYRHYIEIQYSMGEGMKVLMAKVEKMHAVSHTAPATVFEKPSEASNAPQPEVKSPVQPCTHVQAIWPQQNHPWGAISS